MAVPVFRPSAEEWRWGLATYVEKVVEPACGGRFGIAKIIPPAHVTWGNVNNQRRLEAKLLASTNNDDSRGGHKAHAAPSGVVSEGSSAGSDRAVRGAGGGKHAGGGAGGPPAGAPRVLTSNVQCANLCRRPWRLQMTFKTRKYKSVAKFYARAQALQPQSDKVKAWLATLARIGARRQRARQATAASVTAGPAATATKSSSLPPPHGEQGYARGESPVSRQEGSASGCSKTEAKAGTHTDEGGKGEQEEGGKGIHKEEEEEEEEEEEGDRGKHIGEEEEEEEEEEEDDVAKVVWSDEELEAYEGVERELWRGVGPMKAPAEYCSDVKGTLFEEEALSGWAINHLDSVLHIGVDAMTKGRGIPGVTTAMLYLGTWRSLFCWHVEDMDLYSVNYMHFGAPKLWYGLSPQDSDAFERYVASLHPSEFASCPQYLRHKLMMLSPTAIEKNTGIVVQRVIQYPGEFVMTFPRGYHAGFNAGWNCAEAVNFATPAWATRYGRNATWCTCLNSSVRVVMDTWMELVREHAPGRLHATPVAGDRLLVRWADTPGWRLIRLVPRASGRLFAVPTVWGCLDVPVAARAAKRPRKHDKEARQAEQAHRAGRAFDPSTVQWRWVTAEDRKPPRLGSILAMRWANFGREFMVKVKRRPGTRTGLAVTSATDYPFDPLPFDPLEDEWRYPEPHEVDAMRAMDTCYATSKPRAHHRRRRTATPKASVRGHGRRAHHKRKREPQQAMTSTVAL